MSNGFSDNIELFLDHGCLQIGDEGGEGDEVLHGRDAGGAPAQGQVVKPCIICHTESVRPGWSHLGNTTMDI